MTAVDPPAVVGVSQELASRLYPQFISAAYDSLIGPTSGTIPSFRSVCEKLWPRFVAPVLTEDPPGTIREWDFARLLVRNRALFQQQGEAMLIHRITSLDSISPALPASVPSTTRPLTLPYIPTLILTSAYVASYTPQRLDTVFFSKFLSSSASARSKRVRHQRRLKLLSQGPADDNRDDVGPSTPSKKVRKQPMRTTKSTLGSALATSSAAMSRNGLRGPSAVLTARPFTLERLLAIYHVIDPNPPANAIRAPAVADAIYAELATLRRLRLVLPASGAGAGGSIAAVRGLGAGGAAGGGGMTPDVGEKWCINVSGDWIEEIAKGIGVDVGEWLAGGLD
jgi:origin recognition complex subunit 5